MTHTPVIIMSPSRVIWIGIQHHSPGIHTNSLDKKLLLNIFAPPQSLVSDQ